MSEPVHLSSALERHPEMAAKIGRIVADYAALELICLEVHHILSADTAADAFSRFFALRSVNRKMGLLESHLPQLSPELARALKRLVRRMKGAAARRTEVTHVFLQDTVSGLQRLHLYGDSAVILPLDDKLLKRTVTQYQTLAADIQTFQIALFAIAPPLEKRIDQLVDWQCNLPRASQTIPGPEGRLEAAGLNAALGRLGIRLGAHHFVVLKNAAIPQS